MLTPRVGASALSQALVLGFLSLGSWDVSGSAAGRRNVRNVLLQKPQVCLGVEQFAPDEAKCHRSLCDHFRW